MLTHMRGVSRGIIFCFVLLVATAISGCKEDNGGGNPVKKSSRSSIQSSSSSGSGPVIPNPEPSTWILLGSGMAGIGIWHWVKSKKNRK